MLRFEFRLPDIGEGIAEAEIVEWHAGVGDAVREGQVVVAVMTDKATVEMEAPVDGVLLERHGAVGGMVAVGGVLFVLETDAVLPAVMPGAEPVAVPPEGPAVDRAAGREAGSQARRALASPAVRQRARALGIDLALVAPEGTQVRHADLDRYILEKGTAPRAAAASLPVLHDPALHGEEIPLTGLRRQIARRMQEAKQHIPHFTYVDELDVTALEQHRAALNRGRAAGEGEGQPLPLLPFLVVALCRALRDYPALNAHYDDAREVLIRFAAVHVGIAVQTAGGLMVPVLRDAQAMDLFQVAQGIADLAERARSGAIGSAELRGSTITVSSLGKLGGVAATPIINRPEVAIIAPHRIIDRPALVAGKLEPRKIMNLSISCDHRVVDGYTAAACIQAIGQSFVEPQALAAR